MIALSALLFSCSEDEVQKYTGPVSVNIQSNNESELAIAFLEHDNATLVKTFKIDISVQGPVSDQDRVVKFSLGTGQTAVEGTNYKMPMEAVIEAGKLDTNIICEVYKEGLSYDALFLDLGIAPNEDFAGGGVYSRLSVKLKFGYPEQWYASEGDSFWGMLLGKCTEAKYQFVYETIGTIDLKDYAKEGWGAGFVRLRDQLNALLEKDPRIDDDGSVMKFG